MNERNLSPQLDTNQQNHDSVTATPSNSHDGDREPPSSAAVAITLAPPTQHRQVHTEWTVVCPKEVDAVMPASLWWRTWLLLEQMSPALAAQGHRHTSDFQLFIDSETAMEAHHELVKARIRLHETGFWCSFFAGCDGGPHEEALHHMETLTNWIINACACGLAIHIHTHSEVCPCICDGRERADAVRNQKSMRSRPQR